ncbi:MAG: EVE domain-containing protein [Elainellaceae cyanobacterium]
MNYWLMKSEPDVYSIADLESEGETIWDGVRNYQARNFLRSMAVGDRAFFYHSNTKPPGIAGLMQIVQPDVTDPTQFDPKSKYYDPKSSPDDPRWQTVQVAYIQTFPRLLTLESLRQQFTPEELWILRRGNRLSVIPVEAPVAEKMLALATADSPQT